MARVCEHSVEHARDATQVKCVRQQCAVANLAPGPRAHEPPQLGMALPCTLSGLVLKAAERLELALNSKQPLDRWGAKRADQFVFEVRVTHEKSKRFRIRATEVRSKPHALETTPKVLFIVCVDQSRQPHPWLWRAQCFQELAGVRGAADGKDDDPIGREVHAAPMRECLKGCLIAPALH